MKKVKQILIAIAAVTLLLLLCFGIYYKISLATANRAPIHDKANWVIKIDGVEIFKTLYSDLIWESSDRQLQDSSHFRMVNSITFPLNIYVFNTELNPVGFYTSLILQDEKILINNLHHQNKWNLVDTANNIYKNKQSPTYIAFNRQRVFFAWNINQDSEIDILKDLVQQKATLPFNKTKFVPILDNNNSIVSATNLKETLYLNAANDSILITGELEWTLPLKEEVHIKPSNDSLIADICIHKQAKISFPNILTLDSSTLAFFSIFNNDKHINLAAKILDTNVVYQDTEVVFELDENFENVKNTKTTDKRIPLIQAAFQETTGLSDFQIGRSSRIDGKFFPFFPIYNIPYNALSNSPNIRVDKNITHTNCGFNVTIQLNKLQHLDMLDRLQTYFAPFNILHIKGTIVEDKKLTVGGFITIDNQNENALKTIYKTIKL